MSAELCAWLRENSSGVYRRSSEAADRIERLEAELDELRATHQSPIPAKCGDPWPGECEYSFQCAIGGCCDACPYEKRNRRANPSPIPAQTPDDVPFIRQKCDPTGQWVETTREALDAMDPRVRAVFDVRTLYTAPVEASACPTCPKDTPYGPAFCGKCMEAVEASAGDRLTDDLVDDALAKVLELGTVGAMKWLASHIKAGGQVGSGEPCTTEAQEVLADVFTNSERPDKITVALDRKTNSATVVYEDMDEGWFAELAEAINSAALSDAAGGGS